MTEQEARIRIQQARDEGGSPHYVATVALATIGATDPGFWEETIVAQHALNHLRFAKEKRIAGDNEYALVHERWYEGLKSEVTLEDIHNVLEEYELSV